MRRANVFEKVRSQALAVRSARKQMNAALSDEKEFYKKRLEKEEALLKACEVATRKSMETLKPELYAFAAMYYLGGMSLTDSADAICKSQRQCMRYKKQIEEMFA
ncbi:MAG: hypothetical protein IJD60_04920 [Clostridia bacterium]|nr:hypothetical protein [Clostridia bacterium]